MFHMAQIHRGNRQSRRSTVDFLGKKTEQVLIILPKFYDMMIVPIGDSPRWGKKPPSNLGDIPMLGKQAIQSGAPRSIAKLSYKPHENSCYLRIINYSEIGENPSNPIKSDELPYPTTIFAKHHHIVTIVKLELFAATFSYVFVARLGSSQWSAAKNGPTSQLVNVVDNPMPSQAILD